MSGPDPVDVRREIEQWLAVARDDREAALVCLDARTPLPTVAAYHCQQAAEKLLKGFLVHAAVEFGKTHDMAMLGEAAISAFPDLAAPIATVKGWTIWNFVFRYPAAEEPAPVPTPETLRAAISTIDDLAARLRGLAAAMPTA